jgi:hypothetical protein
LQRHIRIAEDRHSIEGGRKVGQYVIRDQDPEAFAFYAKRVREAGVSEKFALHGRTATVHQDIAWPV